MLKKLNSSKQSKAKQGRARLLPCSWILLCSALLCFAHGLNDPIIDCFHEQSKAKQDACAWSFFLFTLFLTPCVRTISCGWCLRFQHLTRPCLVALGQVLDQDPRSIQHSQAGFDPPFVEGAEFTE